MSKKLSEYLIKEFEDRIQELDEEISRAFESISYRQNLNRQSEDKAIYLSRLREDLKTLLAGDYDEKK